MSIVIESACVVEKKKLYCIEDILPKKKSKEKFKKDVIFTLV